MLNVIRRRVPIPFDVGVLRMQEDNTEEHYIRPRRNVFIRLLAWFLSNPIKPAILGVIILLTGSVVCEVSFVRNDFKYTTVSTLGEAYTVLFGMLLWITFFLHIFCFDWKCKSFGLMFVKQYETGFTAETRNLRPWWFSSFALASLLCLEILLEVIEYESALRRTKDHSLGNCISMIAEQVLACPVAFSIIVLTATALGATSYLASRWEEC